MAAQPFWDGHGAFPLLREQNSNRILLGYTNYFDRRRKSDLWEEVRGEGRGAKAIHNVLETRRDLALYGLLSDEFRRRFTSRESGS